MTKKITIDLTPLEEFKYNQISNYKFEFMLVNHDLKVVHSPFECKDYIQDIFYCEANSKSSSLFGLNWKPGMFDITTPFFYLALSGGKEILNVRIKPLQKFLNSFEKNLGIEPTVIYETENPKIIVLKFDKDWAANGAMISAYTTLIRIAGAYEEGNPLEYLVDVQYRKISVPDYTVKERERLENHITKLAGLYEGKRPSNHTWEELESIRAAHENGIMATTDFPTGKLPQRA